MSEQQKGHPVRQYVAVVRAGSSVQFKQNEPLIVQNLQTKHGSANLTFRTRSLDRGFEAPLPGDLWVEVRGPAPSIQVAADSFVNLALSFLHVLAVSANAPVDQPELELAFDVTDGENEHEFFQNFLPEESAVPKRQGRLIDVTATVAFLQAWGLIPTRSGSIVP